MLQVYGPTQAQGLAEASCLGAFPRPMAFAGTTLAAKKKPTGEVKNRAAFANIKSYCIDLSGLEDYESTASTHPLAYG